ncbi:hypothetical protein [Pedobacter rhodius]|uniref:Restriction endonuclease n=1 Tax=Pedobacter rhodius TaxID=3004098 RepID=A0ABT4KT21_9SPHI|nr:hypothetical protein [Pedobacter sp. SJ11]MCZ4221935.1 hypothetical protein [Pedobacter sp. SJ11]
MNIFEQLNYKLSEVKKFYFFDYFYILLKAIEEAEGFNVFVRFQNLKQALNLGESKYKKIGAIAETISDSMLNRYWYTFGEVVEESVTLGLIQHQGNKYKLSEKGYGLLETYKTSGQEIFNEQLFTLIESRSFGFHYLLTTIFANNQNNAGTLVFPSYSPLKLHFSKQQLVEENKFVDYLNALCGKLMEDIFQHIGIQVNLNTANNELIDKLVETGLIDKTYNLRDAKEYNLIVKRVRDFWASHFLRNIYGFKNINSISNFDIWVYRAKQLGILNITEFHPGFSGKMIYPTSIIYKKIKSSEFKKIYEYPTGDFLYIHNPSFSDSFISSLYESYIELKRSHTTYFVNLNDIRDIVCYKLKISNKKFSDLLSEAYELNLKGTLSISISLEADKLPSEKAVYLIRDPIYIGGKVKNIIAIEINTNKK